MIDTYVLEINREDILRAEIAALLHNLGKFDPNFLIFHQIGVSPETLLEDRYIKEYHYKRFADPTILESVFPNERKRGVLFFCDIDLRDKLRSIENEIQRLRRDLSNETDSKVKAEIAEQIKERKRKKEEEKQKESKDFILNENKIESLKFSAELFQDWPLGSFLTLFSDDNFDRPFLNDSNYEPGTTSDPDYHRQTKSTIRLENGYSMEFPLLLILSHGEISGQEKKGIDKTEKYFQASSPNGEQKSIFDLYRSTPFGYETRIDWTNWQIKRAEIFSALLTSWGDPAICRNSFIDTIQCLSYALGDTQRPLNEISLLDYSQSTAALFKTAFAHSIIKNEIVKPIDTRWRFGAIRLNAFEYLFSANQLTDLISRKIMLENLWNHISEEIEVRHPIASVVYRDEHGIAFVIPDLAGEDENSIREFFNSIAQKATEKGNIENSFDFFDIKPSVSIGDPARGKKLNLHTLISNQEPTNEFNPGAIRKSWENQNTPVCAVCQIRPIGLYNNSLPSFVSEKKASDRNLCGVCLARRGRRSQQWAESGSSKTIWINEVADVNGRLAIITGRFDLNNWLNGNLIKTISIGFEKENPHNLLAKAPTFARIHRTWKTAYNFWKETKDYLNGLLTDGRCRLMIWIDKELDLGSFHAYELDLKHVVLNVVWIPASSNKEKGYFVSADNLCYIAKMLGAEKDIHTDELLAVNHIKEYMLVEYVAKNMPIQLKIPETDGQKLNSLVNNCQISMVKFQDVSYSTSIPIILEPQTFMAIVPADKAFEIAKKIKIKYYREMGKVLNRLPLHLGIVYFHRRTPLRTALDAGKRIIRQKAIDSETPWTITNIEKDRAPKHIGASVRRPEPGGFSKSYLIHMEQSGRVNKWFVPMAMGDGETEDDWYPYVFIETTFDNDSPGNRSYSFEGHRPSKNGLKECWLTHARELKIGDKIYFDASTFDFEWLNTSARRFEIAYNREGKRRCNISRPYLMDEVESLELSWLLLSQGLSNTQVHAFRELIETKRSIWNFNTHEDHHVFFQFCYDVTRNLEWRKTPEPDELAKLAHWASTGLLSDAIELNLEIMKRRTSQDKKEAENNG